MSRRPTIRRAGSRVGTSGDILNMIAFEIGSCYIENCIIVLGGSCHAFSAVCAHESYTNSKSVHPLGHIAVDAASCYSML